MQLNTNQNIEESALEEIMRSLGMDDTDVAEMVAAATTPELEKVEVKETPQAEQDFGYAPKKEPLPRQHYANKVERMKVTLAGKFGDAMMLTKDDLKLEGEARLDKQLETAKLIKGAGVKVQNRVTFLIEYAQGRTDKLNNVMQTALDVLKADGKLTSGNEGNLLKALLASGKTERTSKAMAGNTIAAMKLLRMIEGKEPHTFYPNPESALLERLSKMGDA